MRDFKGMKRQRGRNRGGGGQQGGKQQHNVNRAFDSNGPDGVKIRGNAQHVYEKYQQLARDSGASGDRVLAENYLQHAEHYFRVLRAVQPQRPVSEIVGRDGFGTNYDIDFEDESGAQAYPAETAEEAEAGEGEAPRGEYRPEGQRFEGQRPEGQRQDGQREWRDRGDRNRPEGQRQEGRRDDRNFNRDRDRNRNRDDQREREPVAAAPAEPQPEVVEPAVQLRSEDGDFSPAPAFLQPREPRPEAAVEGEDGRPRRRRRRRAGFEGDEGGAPAPESEEA